MKKLLFSVFILSLVYYAFSQDTCDLKICWDTVTTNPCQGVALAFIEIEVCGGTPPYTYKWTGPNNFRESSQNVYNLRQGLYGVTITDANGCTFSTRTYIVVDADPIALSIDHKNYGNYQVSCHDSTDGKLIIGGAQGGNGDYRDWIYHWTTPCNFESWEWNISGLCPGQYYLELWDSIGCYHKIDEFSSTRELEAIYIREPPPISLDSFRISTYNNYYNTSCYDCRDGSIEVFITHNRLHRTYDYYWDTPDGQIENPVDTALYNLPFGIYTLELTDNFGCPFTRIFTLVQSPQVINDTIPVYDTIRTTVFDTTFITVTDTVFQFATGCTLSITDPEGSYTIDLTQVEDYIYLSRFVHWIKLIDLEGYTLRNEPETDRLYVGDIFSGVYIIRFETSDSKVFTRRVYIH